jgi:hypothetical protein
MANRTLVAENGGIGTFEIDVKDGDKAVKAQFKACKDAKSFKSYVQGLGETAAEGEASPLENVFNLYMYAADLKARAAARESVAAESTIVRRDGKEIDIFKLPVERAVGAINAAYAEVAMLGGKPGTAFSASRRKLLEAGKVVETNGVLSVKK